MTTRAAFSWGLLLLVAACSNGNDETPPAIPPEFALSPTVQWSGGTVALRSEFLRDHAQLPTIRVAGIEATITRVDDSTASISLPVLSSQDAAVEVIDGPHTFAGGTVSIKGFRGRRTLPRVLSWEPVVLPSADGPLLINLDYIAQQTLTSTGIATLRTGQVQLVTGLTPVSTDLRGPGASFVPGTLILRDSTGKIGMWQVTPALALTDTAPFASNFPYRNVARLGDSVWLKQGSHTTSIYRGSAPEIALQVEDPFGVDLSLAADRAVIRAFYAVAGAPVLRMSTGDTLYRIGLHYVTGSAFSADGSLLHVTGDDTLLTVGAASGTPVHRVNLPAGDVANGIALSDNGTWLFVAARHGDVPTVLVYDAGTLELRGRMATTDGQGCDCQGLESHTLLTPAVDGPLNTLYLQGTVDALTYIWDFDLLP